MLHLELSDHRDSNASNRDSIALFYRVLIGAYLRAILDCTVTFDPGQASRV